MILTLSQLILINWPYSLSLDLKNILKMVNNLIETLLGEISRNDLWVLEISCILASPQNFVARTHPMLQKLTLPLSEECVLVVHSLPQHTVFSSSPITLLMSGCHCPPTTAQLWYVLLLALLNYCQHCIFTATPSHLLLLQLQLRSIQNIKSSVFSMMHLSPES